MTDSGIVGDIYHRLESIYTYREPETLMHLAERLAQRVGGGPSNRSESHQSKWTEKTCLLITYADSIKAEGKSPLCSLSEFISEYIEDEINTIHILPFYPSSSDDGFSVIDHTVVHDKFGDWSQIASLSKNKVIMADVVLNHGSRESAWFKQFLVGEKPGADYFFSPDENFDLSKVVRPRDHSVLSPVNTPGGQRLLWCTFSEDQIDFDFSNPDVLEQFIGIILGIVDQGIRILRLDAVGYLWKCDGSSCLNLPETHAIIKLIRFITDLYDADITLVSETNLPNHENLSYFGNGNEAHWIYNFSLPPLILNSLLFADSEALRSWSMSMPPALEGTSYLNFLSSHDGFGMRPTEGILTESQRSLLLNRLEANGSLFTWRHVSTERKSIYEANITLFSALEKTDDDPTGIYQIERFIAAHTILFCLEGVPALYINNLFGSRNDTPGAKKSGINRRINREKFSMEWVRNCFEDSGSKESLLFSELKRLLKLRAQQAAFHPNATQFTLQLGSHLFGVWRQSSDRKQSIFAITNLLSDDVILDLSEINLINTESWMDLIQNKKFEIGKRRLRLEAYQSVWITNNA